MKLKSLENNDETNGIEGYPTKVRGLGQK